MIHRDFADISDNNAGVNLREYAKGHSLIAIKLGGGHGDEWNSYSEFPGQWALAGNLGLKRWCYWYFIDNGTVTSGYDQAIQIHKLLSQREIGKPRHGDRVVIDWETYLSAHSTPDQVRTCIATLKRLGHSPILYCSPGFTMSFGNPKFGVDLWIADYASKIWNPGKYKIAAWQHGTVVNGKGIGSPPYGAIGIGYCDMSVLTRYGIRKHMR